MTKQKTKPRHLFIHLLNYVIHTNALRQKEKKKKDVQEMHILYFSIFSAVSRKCRLLD